MVPSKGNTISSGEVVVPLQDGLFTYVLCLLQKIHARYSSFCSSSCSCSFFSFCSSFCSCNFIFSSILWILVPFFYLHAMTHNFLISFPAAASAYYLFVGFDYLSIGLLCLCVCVYLCCVCACVCACPCVCVQVVLLGEDYAEKMPHIVFCHSCLMLVSIDVINDILPLFLTCIVY